MLDICISDSLSRSNSLAYGEAKVWNDIYSGQLNSDILIYGSSRAWVQFDPAIVKRYTGLNTYNVGIDGYNFDMQYFRHKEILKHNLKPKYIILSVDIFTLEKRNDLYNKLQFLPNALWNTELQKSLKSYKGLQTIDFLIPMMRYRGQNELIEQIIKNKFLNTDTVTRVKGFMGQEKSWNRDFENGIKDKGSYTVKIDLPSERLLQNFLEECNSSNIKVIIVYPPEYVGAHKFITNRDIILSKFKSISTKNRLTFLDYSKDSIALNRNLYYNSLHLNKQGASVFTNRLMKDIGKLIN